MAVVLTDDTHYKNIAAKIRENSDAPPDTTYKPSEMAEGVSEVYLFGKKTGRDEEHDAFWDTFQNHGGEANYYYAFAYDRFTDETYDPKYDIKPLTNNTTSASLMFINNTSITDTKVAIHIPKANTNLSNAFKECTALKTIRKIIFNQVYTTALTSAFTDCTALENLVFEGVVRSSINLNWSPLTVESMKSVIRALQNLSGTSYEGSFTLQFSSDCWAKLDAEGATSPTGNTWREYVTEDLKWEI